MDTKELAASLKKIPWWGYAGGGGVVLALAYYVRKQSQTPVQISNAPGANMPDQGLQLADLAGMPYETFDPSYHSYPYPYGQNPSGYDPTTTPASGAPTGTIETPPMLAPGPGGLARPPAATATAPTPTPGAPSQPSPSQPTAPAGGPYWHEVHDWPAWDSTLAGIGGHYGMSWQQLYNFGNDRQIIDSTAHAHGHYGDEYNWLFPGERLQVPSAN